MSAKQNAEIRRSSVYQFKITLKESQPPIWRRIQVKDCTLDKLQEHIQTAMGWTNSHLHHFKIGDKYFGEAFDPAAATKAMKKGLGDRAGW